MLILRSICIYAERWHEAYSYRLVLAFAFLLPLRLSLCYIPLLPALLLWLIKIRGRVLASCSPTALQLFLPLILFLLVAALCSLIGLNPQRSLWRLSHLGFFACIMPLVAMSSKGHGCVEILLALFAGQTVGAMHTIIDAGFGGIVPDLFLGSLTESSQLALSLPVALGLAIALISVNGTYQPNTATMRSSITYCFLHFCVFTLFAFSTAMPLERPLFTALLILIAVVILNFTRKLGSFASFVAQQNTGLSKIMLEVVLPCFACALLVNLKRGPWTGVAVASLILILLYGRRYFVPLLSTSLLLAFLLNPVRERIDKSWEHFFIGGGRAEIWEIGAELSARYPLGVGFGNAKFLRNYSRQIPPQHGHFHNNFINVIVETGWLAFGIYLWWIFSLLRISLNSTSEHGLKHILTLSIGCAILSWQTAGLVEYNFGNSEVLLMVFVLVGLLAALKDSPGLVIPSALSLFPAAAHSLD